MEKLDIMLRFLGNESDEEIEMSKRFTELAFYVNASDIDSREKTIAMERLEESFMWAKKGLLPFEV